MSVQRAVMADQPPGGRAHAAPEVNQPTFGTQLGGKAFEATGSYDWMWYADIALAVGAALVHLPIREARLRPSPVTA